MVMIRNARWILILFLYEIVRLFLVFNIASVVFNGEGYLDTGIMIFFTGIPSLLFPVMVLAFYQNPENEALKTLLLLGKGLMFLSGLPVLLLVSSFGLMVAQVSPGIVSFRVPPAIISFQVVICLADLIFLVVLLLFKPARNKVETPGIPAPPVIRIEEE